MDNADKLNIIIENLGIEETLHAIVLALGDYDKTKLYDFIIRTYDIDIDID